MSTILGFDVNSYLTPPELRNDKIKPYNFDQSVFKSPETADLAKTLGLTDAKASETNKFSASPFSAYDKIGMGGLFNEIGALSGLADNFTALNLAKIKQAEAKNSQEAGQAAIKAVQSPTTGATPSATPAATPIDIINKMPPQASNIANNKLILLNAILASKQANNNKPSLLNTLLAGQQANTDNNSGKSSINTILKALLISKILKS